MIDTLTITLDAPIADQSSLTLRAPTAQEVHDAEAAWAKAGAGVASFRDFQTGLASLLSGVDAETLGNLPIRKSAEAFAFIQAHVDGAAAVPSPLPASHEIMLPASIKAANGMEYDRLRLQEPTLCQVRMAENCMNGGTDQAATRRYMMQLVHQVSDIGWLQVQRVPNRIVNEAAAYCMAFLADAPETGKS